jgi:hypothetical protein
MAAPDRIMIRVFPRRTSYTPVDPLSFIGDPPLFRPEAEEVHVSCTFTWDIEEALRLQDAWSRYYPVVKIGGPAFNAEGDAFVPGRYVRPGITITSRGCPYRCPWCFVPKREGGLRTLDVQPGNVVADNNLLASPEDHQKVVFQMLEDQRRIVFSGGLDARLLKEWHVDWIRRNDRHIKELWFAADTDNMKHLERAGRRLKWLRPRKKRCYVLIGFFGEEVENAERRLQYVYDLGFWPFAQFYRGPGEQERTAVWADLQRHWSRPGLFKRKPLTP